MKTEQAFNWIDTPYESSNRLVLTKETLQVPGLVMFGKHTMTHAVSPLPAHFHKNYFEITLVTNGTLSFTTDRDYELSGYDIFITAPNEVHSTNLLPLSAGEIIWFQLDATQLDNMLFLDKEGSHHLMSPLLSLNTHKYNTKHTQISFYIKHAFELAKNPSKKYLAAQYLSLALFELFSISQQPISETTSDITAVLSYIKQHICEPLQLEELAAIANLSTSQFKQKFRLQTGIAPRHYINHMKIKYAKKLLDDGLSITQTAMTLGFDTSSYFSVVFKRYNALSPREYLKRKKD